MTSEDTITAHQLLDDLVPKLKSVETMVRDTLSARLMMTTDAELRQQLKTFKTEFELERTMIRMNLESLLNRHAETVEKVKAGGTDKVLELDDHEATALKRIRQLHDRAMELKR
ncbi:hypothetical protein [Halomonas daqiaonensis]|uniref:Uncharacterized protein n=1 Tax=Halomonas daqiaonensis TaxID=650850 RepID=A0A1H7SN30_9GAMM|nr:hypothetical protein [Halomonas daqiaonensis]SEL73779.1 hypothetical protein SAMN04488129_11520 [Halomonas daqiaonensis]